MAIPDFQSIMLPLLRLTGDGKEHLNREIANAIAQEFALTAEERQQLLPSGRQRRFDNRVAWAKAYLRRAGLLAGTSRRAYRITERGQQVLAQKHERIDLKYLIANYPEIEEFRRRRGADTKQGSAAEIDTPDVSTPPLEMLEANFLKLQQVLAADLLDQVKKCSPGFFEQLVVDLLVAMGYGGSPEDAAAVGRAGDGEIDGIIKEDKLGLDIVYVQAKRWEGSVGSGEIRSFVGGLEGRHANKGVFLTTSHFSKAALEYARNLAKKVVLIDGALLVELMITYNVGVASVQSFVVKKIDYDYFEEE